MHVLSNRTAVITGAGSGLGRAIALACAEAGMDVVAADIDLPAAESTAAHIVQSRGRAMAIRVDVADPEAVERLAEAAAAFGDVGLLVNNAGVMIAGPAWETPLAEWRWALDINLMGVVHGLHSFVPRMIAAGTEAHIVNTASLAGLLSGPGMAGYAAGKHAVVALSECLAHDLMLSRVWTGARTGVRTGARIGVSVLCPGFVPTRIDDVARYGRQPDMPASTRDAAMARRAQRQHAAARVTAEDVAARVMDAIRDDRFYVLTHEGGAEAVARRAQAIADGRVPPIVRL